MTKIFINSALRHAVGGIGAALVAKGIIQPGQESAFVEMGVGGGLYVATQVVSWLNAKKNLDASIY
jgi:hypothetical protein